MKLVVPTVRIAVLGLLLTIFSARAFSQSIISENGKYEIGIIIPLNGWVSVYRLTMVY